MPQAEQRVTKDLLAEVREFYIRYSVSTRPRRIGSFLTRYNGLVMNDLEQETRERARRWLETWKQTGAELELERVRRLRALTADEARALARDLPGLSRPAQVHPLGVELVMHQRWFAAATRISRTQ